MEKKSPEGIEYKESLKDCLSPNPPCIHCSDKQVEYCHYTGYECNLFEIFLVANQYTFKTEKKVQSKISNLRNLLEEKRRLNK